MNCEVITNSVKSELKISKIRLFTILAAGLILAITSCGGNEKYTVSEEYKSKPGLPPAPANPMNDCATIVNSVKNPTNYSCDGASCNGSCHMYMLDLDNPGEWVEVTPPVTDSNPRHLYLCRCVK